MTGDTSPTPSLHVTDIYLDRNDSDTMRLTGELMYSNFGTIVSMWLWGAHDPIRTLVQLLPKCPKLSALYIGYIAYINNTDPNNLLVSVIPHLTQLTTVRYDGFASESDAAADRAAVAAVMSLIQLVWVELLHVRLGNDGVKTDAMTRLRTVVLVCVSMTAEAWDRFVSSLLSLPQSVSVDLRGTNIDEGTMRRIQTSDRVTVTRDDREKDYERLEFTTVPSQTA